MKMQKKIPIPNLDQDIYFEKLDNGLDVYLVPFANKNGYYISYGVKFGSIDTCFIPASKKDYVTMPDGITHFLEHKLFEQEKGEKPNEFYSKNGSTVNAQTNFINTRYIVMGTKAIKEDLNYLLDFVSSPYFTDENIEKEKGIIAEEIKMYDDEPDWILDRTTREMTFSKSPYKEDIAGTIKTISKITKEDLYDCYHTFYTPNNMFLIITGKFDQNEIMEIIKNNQSLKALKPVKKIVKKKYQEPKEVVCKYKELKLNITIPKANYVIKLERNKFSIKDNKVLSLYMSFLLDLLFSSSTSEFVERAKINKWLLALYYGFSTAMNEYLIWEFSAETNQPEKFLEEFKKELKNIQVKEADFERIKKGWIADEVRRLDSIYRTLNALQRDLTIYGEIYPNKIDLIRKLKFETLTKMIKELDFTNSATLIALPKENK